MAEKKIGIIGSTSDVDIVRLNEAAKYYAKGSTAIDKVIKADLQTDDSIVHGGKAINAQLPDHLDKFTEDWDIMSVNPAVDAKRLEKLLDKKFGGNYFLVEPAVHEGTFRIRSRVTKRVVADITLMGDRIPSKKIDGINYATLGYHANHIKVTLRDKTSKFRHIRDLETLQRINIHRTKKLRDIGVLKTFQPINKLYGKRRRR